MFTNSIVGVEILQHAAPKLVHNRIYQHPHNVSVEKKATPTVQSNEIFAGKTAGLVIQDTSDASISANTIYANTVSVSGPSAVQVAQLKQTNKII